MESISTASARLETNSNTKWTFLISTNRAHSNPATNPVHSALI